MEIKAVGDLIPYHKSLQELWATEEFQPVLGFLKGLMLEQVEQLQTFSLEQSAEDAKTKITTIKTKMNFINLIHNLPERIKEAAEAIERKGNMKAKFADSQEGGNI